MPLLFPGRRGPLQLSQDVAIAMTTGALPAGVEDGADGMFQKLCSERCGRAAVEAWESCWGA